MLSLRLLLSFSVLVVVASAIGQEPPPAVEPAPIAVPEVQALDNAEKPEVSDLLQKFFGTEEDAKDERTEAPETEESQAAIPDALSPEGDTGEPPERFLPAEYLSTSRKWEPPNYLDQYRALGWSPAAFDVPVGLRKRVDFWISIYSKYTTDQGLLHDSVNVDVVYGAVDFRPIMKNTALSARQKSREREKLVNSKRKEIEERLRKLAATTSPADLTGEDLRVWKMFEAVSEPEKFKRATSRGRVRFQLGQKDRFIVGIYYSGRYIREMEKIFRDNSLPVELTRLPFVESSFNIFARSKVGASGIWQFMRRTARPLMMVNHNVDERNDPIEATRASARMLRSNFEMLQSWPLAVTGYNHGPSGVARIVKKVGTKDLAKIVGSYSSRSFGFASENFYACFLASIEVEKNARKYLGEVKWSTEFQTDEIRVGRTLSYRTLLGWFNGNEESARLHNFHIQSVVRKGRREIPRGTFIRVPSQFKMAALSYMQGSVVASAPTSERAIARNDKISLYRVRRGDNLSTIARSFGVTISEIKRANNLRGDRLKHGQKIIIPD